MPLSNKQLQERKKLTDDINQKEKKAMELDEKRDILEEKRNKKKKEGLELTKGEKEELTKIDKELKKINKDLVPIKKHLSAIYDKEKQILDVEKEREGRIESISHLLQRQPTFLRGITKEWGGTLDNIREIEKLQKMGHKNLSIFQKKELSKAPYSDTL